MRNKRVSYNGYYRGFPSPGRGFDSPHPHHTKGLSERKGFLYGSGLGEANASASGAQPPLPCDHGSRVSPKVKGRLPPPNI